MAQINIGRVLPIFRGEYNTNTTYERLDIVSYQGSSYVAKEHTIHNLPTSSHWRLVAQGGTWSGMSETEKEEVIERLADDLVDLSYEVGTTHYSTGTEIMFQDRNETQYLWPATQAKSVWDGSTNVHDKLADHEADINSHENRINQLLEQIQTINTTYDFEIVDGYVSLTLGGSVSGGKIIFTDSNDTTYSKVLDSTGFYSFCLNGNTEYTVTIIISGQPRKTFSLTTTKGHLRKDYAI